MGNMVYQVDSVSTTVDLDFNIYQQWIDPAMINAVKSHGFTRTAAEYEKLCWTPSLEINNNVSLQPLWDGNTCWNLKDESLGLMQYSQRYKGTISNKMYLHFFPFDSNVIEINVGPKYYNLNQIDIETNVKEQNKINESRNCIIPSNLEEFIITKETQTFVFVKNGRNVDYQNINHAFTIQRKATFYLWKIMLVQVFIVMWSWTVFFEDPSDLLGRYEVVLNLFLAAVAFLFVVNDKLPKVAYLTLLDKNLLCTFVLLFCCAVESWIVFIVDKYWNEPDIAVLIDRISWGMFPSCSLLLQLWFLYKAKIICNPGKMSNVRLPTSRKLVLDHMHLNESIDDESVQATQ